MSRRGRILKVAGSLAGAGAIVGVAAGTVAKRRVSRQREATAAAVAELGSLHGDPVAVLADDGVVLHVEVDEAPGDGPTLVFAHGYALNLDCWHYQRAAMRGRHRLVFYDQRSHGRSGRSDRENANIDQLGRDLRAVIEQVVPDGPVILVGHSMGGMSIMAFAEQFPELFSARVAGVALIATTAGGLKPHKILGGGRLPDRLGATLVQRLVAAAAAAPQLTDSARSIGSDIGFLASRGFGFGRDPAPEQVEFLDQMLAQTSVRVLGEFYPSFSALNKFGVLAALAAVPVVIICGTDDRLTSIGHSRKMATLMPTATLIECPDAGHMVILEDAAVVNAALESLVEQA